MAQTSWPYANSATPGVTASRWEAMARLWRRSGVVAGSGSELVVSAVTDVLQVSVASGEAWIDGHYYDNTSAVLVDLDTADLNDDRIDLIVVRSTLATGEAVVGKVTGTPATTPVVAPTPTQDHETAGVYEEVLAEVLVAAAAGNVNGQVTDRRTLATFNGDYVEDLQTEATDTDMVLKPDGAGGVAFASGSSHEDVDQPGNSGVVTLDWSAYRAWDIDPSGPVELAFTGLPDVGKTASGLLVVRNSDEAITWPEGVQAPEGSLTLNGKTHVPLRVERDQTVVIGTPWISVKELVNLPEIGAPFMGGFFAGVIDTTQGNIIGSDDYQSGLRYALIVGPQSIEGGRDTGTGDLTWHSSGSQSPSGASTRWDGLSATDVLRGLSSAYEAATYVWGLTSPADDASRWYLPALDELELVWRNLKPNTNDNYTTDRTGHSFPDDPLVQGVNPSSDPEGSAYTLADPAQTAVADFQDAGDEAMSSSHGYWASTWASSTNAWRQNFPNGYQVASTQTFDSLRVRPVRRLVL